jgi:uncharacterized protein (DUF2062 family)
MPRLGDSSPPNMFNRKDKNARHPARQLRVAPVRAARYQWVRLLRLRGDPRILAKGVAIGVFVGLTPTIPFHSLLILFFCPLCGGNPLAGLLSSVLVSNPVTIPLHYYGAWKIGTLVIGTRFSWEAVQDLFQTAQAAGLLHGLEVISKTSGAMLATLVIGGAFLAAPIALASYLLAIRVYFAYQQRRMKKILRDQADKRLSP